jgi:prevent-host-death family protein
MAARSVGVYEAKTQVPRLLREVAVGDTITITQHGKPVARLVPVERTPEERDRALKAIEEWREYRRKHNITLGPDLTIRQLTDEGRDVWWR